VRAELGKHDDTRSFIPTLPAGLSTLLAAADCARAGGEVLSIFGSGSPALDVELRVAGDALVRLEAKGRSMASLFLPNASDHALRDWACFQVLSAGKALRVRTKRDRASALQIVYLSAFAPARFANDEACKSWPRELRERILATPGVGIYDLPHAVITTWLAVDVRGDTVGADGFYSVVDLMRTRPRAPDVSVAAYERMTRRPPKTSWLARGPV
jgi:hypothetical protein